MTLILCCIQGTLSIAILLGSIVLLATATDKRTPHRYTAPIYGLSGWSAWMVFNALDRKPDSIPAQAMLALVVVVMVLSWRKVHQFINREAP